MRSAWPAWTWRGLVLVALAAACASSSRPAYAGEPTLEASVKAAYLYKFLSFVEWPAAAFSDAADPIRVGVAGDDAVLNELQQVLPARTVHGRKVLARRVRVGDPAESLHVLFAGRALARHPWLATQAERPLLLVTDAPQGLDSGSTINFLLVDGRVRFEVSLTAAERTGMRLSSRLLGVAERVVGGR